MLCVLVMALTTTACWDHMETERLAIVGAFSYDRATPGQVLLSLEVTNTEALSRLTPGGPPSVTSWILTEQGRTAFGASDMIQRRLPRGVFIGQATSLILGRGLAEAGIAQYLDIALRQFSVRRTIAVVTCDSGVELLTRPFMEEVASQTVEGLLDMSKYSGMSTKVTLNEFIARLKEPGIEPFTTYLTWPAMSDVQVRPQGKNSPGGEMIPSAPFLAGVAAYREDRLVGMLDGKDARGFLWTQGNVRETPLELLKPIEGVQDAVLRTTATNAAIRPKPQPADDDPHFTIRVDVVAHIAEMYPEKALTPAMVRGIEAAAEQAIKDEIRHTLTLVQGTLKTDIYGFGQALYRHDYQEWKTREPDWNTKWFPRAKVSLDVNVNIRTSEGLLNTPR